jgi:hypothetical protein
MTPKPPSERDREAARSWWNNQDYHQSPEQDVDSLAQLLAQAREEGRLIGYAQGIEDAKAIGSYGKP